MIATVYEYASRRAVRIGIAASILCALAPGPAAAEWGRGHPPHDTRGSHGPPPVGGFIERHAERLELDEPTVAKIRKVVDASREQSEDIREQIRGEYTAMRSLLDADTPDEGAVMKQVDRIGALHIRDRKNRLRAMLAIRAMLTSEQRAELQEIRRELEASGESRHGWHGGHGHDKPGPGADRAPR